MKLKRIDSVKVRSGVVTKSISVLGGVALIAAFLSAPASAASRYWILITHDVVGAGPGVATSDGGYLAGSGPRLVKLSAEGTIEWMKQFNLTDAEGTEALTWVRAVRQTQDDGYIILSNGKPYNVEEFWLMKLGAAGNVEWHNSYRSPGNFVEATDVQEVLDSQGDPAGYAVAGHGPSSQPEHGPYGMLLMRTDALGNVLWQRTYGAENIPGAVEPKVGAKTLVRVLGADGQPDGYLLASALRQSGNWPRLLRVTEDGEPMWDVDLYLAASVLDVQQAFAPTGEPAGFVLLGRAWGAGSYVSPLVLRLSNGGQVTWQKAVDSSSLAGGLQPEGIVQALDGGFVVSATLNHDSLGSAALLKLSPDGDFLWMKDHRGQLIRAFGESLLAQAPDGSLMADVALWDESIERPTGGIVRFNAEGAIPECSEGDSLSLPLIDLSLVSPTQVQTLVTTAEWLLETPAYEELQPSGDVIPLCCAPSNLAPIAVAGPDQTLPCTCASGEAVALDGSASSDPDGDRLTYLWTWSFGTAVGVSPTVTLAYGTSTVSLVVNDGTEDSAADAVDITVEDTAAPELALASDSVTVVLPSAGAAGAPVDVLAASGAEATDACCDAGVTLAPSGTSDYSIGRTTVYVTASDCHGNAGTAKPFIVNVAYNFSGFLPPIRADGSSIFRSGRTIPVKFRLTAADGAIVSNATATLMLAQISGNVIGSFEEITPEAAGNSNFDNRFRFDPISGVYIYNLQATEFATGTYVLRAHLSDGTDHDVYVSVR